MMRWFTRAHFAQMSKTQVFLSSQLLKDSLGLTQGYEIIHRVPGPTLGDIHNPQQPVVLWLHGGAFLLPAVPDVHLRLLAHLCKGLNAVGFLPDYRLAPFNRFPAALNDCVRAYQGLLAKGFAPSQIVIGGDSAGGNLTLGVLQRVRSLGLPMPSCAILVSAVTEMGRIHAPPSRASNARRDPMIPIGSMYRMDELYAGDWDASDPELSPLYADYQGFPPLYFLVGETEVLRDDSVLAARQAQRAGVQTTLDVWPLMPHAFPLFERLFSELTICRADMIAFARKHLKPAS